MRVVSVLPSATETVCALGERRSLVGRSEECDYPAEVRSVPIVMRARTLDASRPSAEIDGRVQSVRASDESLYTLDTQLLAELAPDLILTQDLCRVCSVTDAEVLDACRSAKVTPQLLSLTPRDLGGVASSIDTIAKTLGVPGLSIPLSAPLRNAHRAAQTPSRGPRVALLEWLDPPILAGLWGPEMVVAAGGTPVQGTPQEPGVRTTWDALHDLAPELVVVSPCSFSVERTTAELEGNARVLGSLGALTPPLGTWLADEAHFSRPGPRLIHGVELLRDLAAGRPPATPMPVVRWVPAQAGP